MIIGATSAEHFNNEQLPLLMNDILLLWGGCTAHFEQPLVDCIQILSFLRLAYKKL